MQIRARDTLLTSLAVTDFFGEVAPIDNDVSLYALVRAIVINHCDDDLASIADKSHISLAYGHKSEDVSIVAKAYTSYAISLVIMRDNISSVETPDGWTPYNGAPYFIDRYLSQTVKTKVFTNSEQKRIVVVVEKKITHQWIQAFESMLLCLMPWYYPSKSEEEIAFFKKFSIKDNPQEAINALIDYVNKAAEKIDFRGVRISKLLKGIGDSTRSTQIKLQKDQIKQLMQNIESTMRNLARYYSNLDDAQCILNGLESQKANSDDEYIEFFRSHNNIELLEVAYGNIRYEVTDVLDFYDQDEAASVIDNPNGWVRNGYSSNIVEAMKCLFVENRGLINVVADFTLNDMRLVTPISGSYQSQNAMPNPHVYFFACSGGNDQYYAKYAKEGDWQLGIEQSIAAAKNWNVGDTTVGRKMFDCLQYSTNKCIWVTDGSPIYSVTPEAKLVTFSDFCRIARNKKELEEAQKGEDKDGETASANE